MGRSRLMLGQYGAISTRPVEGGWESRARLRCFDGQLRIISGRGTTKSAAQAQLRENIDKRRSYGATVNLDSTLAELAAAWLAQPHEWSIGTDRVFRQVVKNNVVPALGAIRIAEARTSVINRAIATIKEKQGYGVARTSRTVLRGMFAFVVADGVLTTNPVNEVARINRPKQARKTVRALTHEQAEFIIDAARSNAVAVAQDLPDLIEWMLGTGVRIGEALAIRNGINEDMEQLLDLEAGVVEVNATIVRVPRQGLLCQERTKTEAGWRRLAIPNHLVDMVERRRHEARLAGPGGVLFAQPGRRALRDPTAASGNMRGFFDALDCETCGGTGQLRGSRCLHGPYSWVTSHVFRKTVATWLDEAGLSWKVIADQLGHSRPSITADLYMGRFVVSGDAARALER